MSIVRGVDGCRAGWLCMSLDSDATAASAQVFADSETLFRDPEWAVTAIDIPIGLPTSQSRGCDSEARRLLGPRRSSVFPTPMRAALEADSYESACAANKRSCGKRLSKQTYAILPKIREVDASVRGSPALVGTVWEVHPEVSFYFWNRRTPMLHPKRSRFGFSERLQLVKTVFGNVAQEIRESIPRKAAADDDILDALAALWTAQRIHAGTAVKLPHADECDKLGFRMQILA